MIIKYSKNSMQFLTLLILVTATSIIAETTPTVQLVKLANEHYQNSEIEQAIELYDTALEAETEKEPAIVLFNKATALLKQGDIEDAVRFFKKSSRATKDISLKAKCNYHLGHCSFLLSAEEEELKDRIRVLQRSAKYFSTATQSIPDFDNAAHNLEITKLKINQLLKEQERREELMKEIQDKMQELADLLEKILKEQSELLKQSQDLNKQQEQQQQNPNQSPQKGDQSAQQPGPSPGKTPSLEDLLSQLAKMQSELQKQSGNAAKMANQLGNMPGMGPPGQQGMQGIKSLISRAGNAQGQSMLSLQQGKAGQSQFPQMRASQDIQEALDRLSQMGQGQGEGDKKKGNNPGSSGDKKSNKQKGDKGNKGDKKGKGKNKGSHGETPGDIIEEEQDNKKIRTGPGKDSDLIKVEKDW